MAAAQPFNALFVNYAAWGDGGLYLDHLLTAETVSGRQKDTLGQ